MAGNSFGNALVATTFGESHGAALGCVVDGCPAGVDLTVEHIQAQLDRRRPGQNRYQTQRQEGDRARLLSGVYQGRTLGTPIAVLVENTDAKSSDYKGLDDHYRPGHADYTWDQRFGRRAPRGGGRASARETVGRVAAGAIAEAVLAAWATRNHAEPLQIVAWVQQIGTAVAQGPAPAQILPGHTAGYAFDPLTLTREQVDATPLRCPDPQAHAAMQELLEQAQRERDSLGGVVRCAVRGLPAGWGEPVFDKLTGMLGHALLSLPAARGVQFGTGFAAAELRGTVHNDAFLPGFQFASNHHGGVLGGISTGAPLVVDVAFKPAATIPQPQQGGTRAGAVAERTVTGRHDPCVVPRAVPIVEAAVAFVLADALLAANFLPRET
ncbi:MAG: chorismate synthase [Deltaproteobacteria bacterium]|nr:chorismate synthase [Deltaproteobacteria bacterium]